MNKLENLRMVCFDFDDTLCVHSKRAGVSMIDYMLQVQSNDKGLWADSEPNLQLKKFMDYLRMNGIGMCLLGGVDSFKESERKIEWVRKNYGHSLENYCVSAQELKVTQLKIIAKINGFTADQVAIVDDLYSNLENAEMEGFATFSPMQIVNLFNG